MSEQMDADIRFESGRAVLDFSDFGPEHYDRFLRAKKLPESSIVYNEGTDVYNLSTPARFARLLGVDVIPEERRFRPLAPHLWDYQRFIVKQARIAKRFAIFADCGLGKTNMFLEFARQAMAMTMGKALIVSPRQVIGQTMQEANRFYGRHLPIIRLETRVDLIAWLTDEKHPAKLAITNYEKFIPGIIPEMRNLACLVLDESSALKTKGGKIKWNLMKSSYGIEYKLANTATPAPNDVMEYLSQAGFLDKFNDGSGSGATLASFFTRGKDQEWRLKPLAREAFFRFMASWSIYLRSPAHYGFSDNIRKVPEPVYFEHNIPITPAQTAEASKLLQEIGGGLFADQKMGSVERGKLSQLAKGFIYQNKQPRLIESRKPRMVADLVRRELASGLQVLVWTTFDAEGEILSRLLSRTQHEVLSGKMNDTDRERAIDEFKSGRLPVLISKPSLLGFGQNFQNCGAMIFSGWDDSFERFYQAVRRGFRYGQKKALRVHVPFIPELEGMVWENVQRKADNFQRDAELQEEAYRMALKEAV